MVFTFVRQIERRVRSRLRKDLGYSSFVIIYSEVKANYHTSGSAPSSRHSAQSAVELRRFFCERIMFHSWLTMVTFASLLLEPLSMDAI